jgi:hypothetical protein
MSLAESNTITWDRPTKSGTKDALGHQAVVSAAGFPRQVVGSWQPQARKARQEGHGLVTPCDAVFLSPLFDGGRAGDIATGPDGLRYLALEPEHNNGNGLSLGHSLYKLSRVK